MRRLSLRIDLPPSPSDDAARLELVRLLMAAARSVQEGATAGALRDFTGAECGAFTIEDVKP